MERGGAGDMVGRGSRWSGGEGEPLVWWRGRGSRWSGGEGGGGGLVGRRGLVIWWGGNWQSSRGILMVLYISGDFVKYSVNKYM